jgi:hypothetical protein
MASTMGANYSDSNAASVVFKQTVPNYYVDTKPACMQ